MKDLNNNDTINIQKKLKEIIPLSEAKKSLLKSGYLLEARLENILQKNGYYVRSNVPYPDPKTGVTREIDLDAINAISLKPRKGDFIFLELIIECINNDQPLAFITKEPLYMDYQDFEIKMVGLPEKLLKKRGSKNFISLPEYLGMKEYHHFFKGRIATQYCTFEKKQKGQNKGEWRAFHYEDHHESFHKLCDALEYSMLDLQTQINLFDEDGINIQFFYNILVVQNDLLDIRQIGTTVKIKKTNHIKFLITDFVKGKEKNYVVDVVREGYIENFLKNLQNEMDITSLKISKKYSMMKKEIEKKLLKEKIVKAISTFSNLIGKSTNIEQD